MATRLISLVVAFYGGIPGEWHKLAPSPGSSSQGKQLVCIGSSTEKTVLKSTQRTISSISQRIQTRSGDILKLLMKEMKLNIPIGLQQWMHYKKEMKSPYCKISLLRWMVVIIQCPQNLVL